MRTVTSFAAAIGLLSGGAFGAPLTYTKDVAPIVYEKCLTCHRTGEIAPFSMETFDTIRPWAKSIRKVVDSKVMPPWHADSTKTEFLHDRSLSDAQVKTIVEWVDQGAKYGDEADLPEMPEFNDTWAMGEPDMIFEVEGEFVVPVGDQYIPYQSQHFYPVVEEDLFITEWEIRPSERSTVHHANLVRSPIKMERVGIGEAVASGGDYLGSFLPGARPFGYPAGTAYRIPAGNMIQIQVHYTGRDVEMTEKTRFGVKLAQGRIDKIVRTAGTDDWEFDIAPNDADWVMNTEVKLLFPLTIYSSGAHMHTRGSAYTMTAVLPDGTNTLIADVPRYDFNWQTNYELAKPISVPAGTMLHVEAHYNNSASNKNVADPSQPVVYGPWTENEMLTTWAHVTVDAENQGMIMKDGRMIERAPDGQPYIQPALLQTLPATFTRALQKQAEKKAESSTD